MLNFSRSAQLNFATELHLFGLRLFIRLTRQLNRISTQIAMVRRYYWLPPLAGLVGILIGLTLRIAL